MMKMQMAIMMMMMMVMMLTKSSTICIAYQRSLPQKASSCPLVVITYKLTAIFAITIIITITIATTATITTIITTINTSFCNFFKPGFSGFPGTKYSASYIWVNSSRMSISKERHCGFKTQVLVSHMRPEPIVLRWRRCHLTLWIGERSYFANILHATLSEWDYWAKIRSVSDIVYFYS